MLWDFSLKIISTLLRFRGLEFAQFHRWQNSDLKAEQSESKSKEAYRQQLTVIDCSLCSKSFVPMNLLDPLK